jgi:hypothetical protein
MANHRFTLLLRRRRRFRGGDIRFRSRSRSRHSLTARFQIRAEFRRAFHVVRTHGRSGGAHETFTREFRSSRQAPHGGLRRNRQVGVGALRNGRDCGSREQSQGGSAINLFFRLGGDDSLDLRSSRRLRLQGRDGGNSLNRADHFGYIFWSLSVVMRKDLWVEVLSLESLLVTPPPKGGSRFLFFFERKKGKTEGRWHTLLRV